MESIAGLARRRTLLIAVGAGTLVAGAALALIFGSSATGSSQRALEQLQGNPQPEMPRTTQATGNPMFIPPLLKGTTSGGVTTFNLRAQRGTLRRGGQTLSTMGFNQAYLGPTIRVTRGQRVHMHVVNTIGEQTTVHWHGGHVPAQDDGGPYQMIQPNTAWDPEFTIDQQATTLWYHPHLMGKTAEHVGRGLAGLLEITDKRSVQRKLPHTYGVDDIPIILHGLPGAGADGAGILAANGTLNATLTRKRRRIRLRVLNGTGGLFLGIAVKGAVSVQQIGTDGGLLPRPVSSRGVVLGPSERTELIVTLTKGRAAQFTAVRLADQAGARQEQTAFTRTGSSRQPASTLLTLSTTSAAKLTPLPRVLNAAPSVDLSGAVERDMNLGPTIQINGELMPDPATHDMSQMDEDTEMFHTVHIPLNETDVWTVRNQSPFTHQFHVHDIEFQVLSRDGVTPPAQERGWKDTIHVAPGETVRIAMTFTDFADATHPYMFHCHVLRHEDSGMMGQFVVEPAA